VFKAKGNAQGEVGRYMAWLVAKGSSLSRRKQVRKYLGIRNEDSGGVEGIVLRKGGDVGRRGRSGEMVAV